jgi:hypothetical protein
MPTPRHLESSVLLGDAHSGAPARAPLSRAAPRPGFDVPVKSAAQNRADNVFADSLHGLLETSQYPEPPSQRAVTSPNGTNAGRSGFRPAIASPGTVHAMMKRDHVELTGEAPPADPYARAPVVGSELRPVAHTSVYAAGKTSSQWSISDMQPPAADKGVASRRGGGSEAAPASPAEPVAYSTAKAVARERLMATTRSSLSLSLQ